MRPGLLAVFALALIALSACGDDTDGRSSPTTPALPTFAPGALTLIAAGDIASCDSKGDEATAAIVAKFDGPVLALGDLAYESGTAAEFARCYDPTWGQFKDRTHPAPGNHEYNSAGAAPYFAYFGQAAGEPGKGYYSFDVGGWHLVALNSNCADIGGCGPGSPQERWLRDDLRAHPAQCTLAYWHHPRFSSGIHGSYSSMAPLWQALQDAGADVVLSGHDHHYERFLPMTADGARDDARGIRQFVVGTGGRSLYPVLPAKPGSEVRSAGSYGVLVLALMPGSYSWQFVPTSGSFTDSGTAACH